MLIYYVTKLSLILSYNYLLYDPKDAHTLDYFLCVLLNVQLKFDACALECRQPIYIQSIINTDIHAKYSLNRSEGI